ncbi:hypothetical protein KDH_52560 [Dictyobacter sp. S3.2.2.5]|uniref:Uncharacterized protein n=1 Tax=Dictyobacter halimunensis TaxID=3026934 RepID=A0ABQ6FZN5_9CHLR|nr:hypothetical protein KDH_52560 [Dictyobacter sp. S3.2.2.5]
MASGSLDRNGMRHGIAMIYDKWVAVSQMSLVAEKYTSSDGKLVEAKSDDGQAYSGKT